MCVATSFVFYGNIQTKSQLLYLYTNSIFCTQFWTEGLATDYRAECTDLHAAAAVLRVVLPLPAGGAAGPGPGPLAGGGQGRGLPHLHHMVTMVTTCHQAHLGPGPRAVAGAAAVAVRRL